jgi:predicted alpha/beta superfamily hydrolase
MTEIKYIEDDLIGEKYKPGQSFHFRIAVPCVDLESFGLLVEHDGQNDANVYSLLKLAQEGKAPYCVSIGVTCGYLTTPDGNTRNMRMNSYDFFDREYGDFIVYELIPHVINKYGIKISDSPDMHFISGGSSGGISAFVVAWFHSDYFHRVYMSSPSFLALGRGNEIPYLIRKYETKPFRIYEEWSENEPNDYFGWSRGVDEVAKESLIFAKYDFNYAYFPDEGHCSRYRDENEAYKRNEWIWKDWKTNPIKALANSERVDKVIPFGSTWEKCATFPKKVERDVPPALAQQYKLVVLSNDEQLWYVTGDKDDVIYSHLNNSDYENGRCNLHAVLHTIPRISHSGVLDMAVDKGDRLYVLTEIGVQCIRSYGLIDLILDLPDHSAPIKIAVADALYVQTENGIYKRALCEECTTDGNEKRKQINYYD